MSGVARARRDKSTEVRTRAAEGTDIETLKWCIGISPVSTPSRRLPICSPWPIPQPSVPSEAVDDSLLFQRISHSTYRKVCCRGTRGPPSPPHRPLKPNPNPRRHSQHTSTASRMPPPPTCAFDFEPCRSFPLSPRRVGSLRGAIGIIKKHSKSVPLLAIADLNKIYFSTRH